MVIRSNITALTAQRNLGNTREASARVMEHLSSGTRISRASDDAAGLAISEHLRADIRSMAQVSRNGLDAVSLIQVAEGGLTTIGESLIRMRELSIQSASDTIGDLERGMVDREVQQLKEHIRVTAESTSFNGTTLLSGSSRKMTFQLSLHDERKDEHAIELDMSNIDARPLALGIDDIHVRSKSAAQNNLEKIDYALTELAENRSEVGAFQNRVRSAINQFDIYRENLSAAKSRISDADIALETAEQTRLSVLEQGGISVLAQANQAPTTALKLLS